jgi:hypothetical protein
MSISNVEHYVEQKNTWARIFEGRELSLLNAEDRQAVANSLDADLSPENLTCDGELRGKALQARQRYLFQCAQELISIDSTVTFYEMGV